MYLDPMSLEQRELKNLTWNIVLLTLFDCIALSQYQINLHNFKPKLSLGLIKEPNRISLVYFKGHNDRKILDSMVALAYNSKIV